MTLSRVATVVVSAAIVATLGFRVGLAREAVVWAGPGVLAIVALVLARRAVSGTPLKGVLRRFAWFAAGLALFGLLMPSVSLALGPSFLLAAWIFAIGVNGYAFGVAGLRVPATVVGALLMILGVVVHYFAFEALVSRVAMLG